LSQAVTVTLVPAFSLVPFTVTAVVSSNTRPTISLATSSGSIARRTTPLAGARVPPPCWTTWVSS
jgi:hypothetical protein